MDVDNNESLQRFEIKTGGETAFLTYRLHNGAITLVHTEVPQALAGRGVGSALAAGAFDYARSHKLRVHPVCTFVKGWLERHPDQRDIVK